MRRNELKKTNYKNVYEVLTEANIPNFIVRFSYLNKRYPDKNFTNLFGCTTAKQAFNELQKVKVMLAQGHNPFEKKKKTALNDYFENFIKGIKGKDQYIKSTYYDKHIKPHIGHYDISEIEEKHILKILNSDTLKDKSLRTKYTVKMILNPIFSKSIKNGDRTINPLEDIKFEKKTQKKPLFSRIVDSEKTIVQTFYKNILELEDIELKVFLLIALMTGRRRGEILKLKWDSIYDGKVFVDANMTKTGIDEEYPLPTEVTSAFEFIEKGKSDNIFHLKEDRPTRVFKSLLQKSSIKLRKNETLTLHDTRHLFMSIMTMETKNADLVDKCLSHSKSLSIKDTYLSFSYENRKKVFEDYWEIIRN